MYLRIIICQIHNHVTDQNSYNIKFKMKKTFKNIGIIKNDIRARSTVKVLKKNNQAKATNHNSIADDDNSGKEFHNNAEYRQNEMSIQMLSKSLHDQIFKGCISQKLHPKATEKYSKSIINYLRNLT